MSNDTPALWTQNYWKAQQSTSRDPWYGLESHSILRPLRIIYQSDRWSSKMHYAQSQTADLQVIWNVQFITVFVSVWMIPPVYHSLHRESIKTASSASPIGVQSVRSAWFEDTTPKDTASQPNQDPRKEQSEPLHGLKLVIKEEVLPTNDQPEFPSLELLAARGLLTPDTWKCLCCAQS